MHVPWTLLDRIFDTKLKTVVENEITNLVQFRSTWESQKTGAHLVFL